MNTLLSWLPRPKRKHTTPDRWRCRLVLERLEDRSVPTVLTVSIAPSTFSETAGANAAVGTVTRSGTPLDSPLTVSLQSSDTTEATVPAQVTIAAGQASATFAVNAVDDGVADTAQTVTVTASAQDSSGPVGLDTTFGSAGYTAIPNGYAAVSSNFPHAKLQADGKILAATDSSTTGVTWQLTRTLANGTLDPTFGTNGTVTTTFPGATDGRANNIAIQPDGKIIVIGEVDGASHNNGDWGVARYNADGTLDASFGTNGLARFTLGTGTYPPGGWPYDVTVLANGQILVAGTNFASNATGYTVARLNANGTPDTTFGTGGFASVNPDATHYGTAYAMRVQADGKIVLAGSVSTLGFGVVRFNADGTPDTSFGPGGTRLIASTTFGSVYTGGGDAHGLAIQPDGKIVVGGSVYDGSYHGDWAATRLNTDGTIDTNFGTGGTTTVDFNKLDDRAVDLALQPDGKILMAGAAFDPPNGTDSALVRLNANGTLDTTFNGTGKYTAPPLPSVFEQLWSLSLVPNSGQAVGLVAYANDVRVARFNIGGGGTVTGSTTVSVTDEPRPAVQGDAYSLDENTQLTVGAPGVLANDSGGNGPLSAVLVNGPADGQLTLNADGSFTYTPNTNFNGTDSFTYQATDGTYSSNPATVTLTVNRINSTPVAADDSFSVDENTTLTVANMPPTAGAGVTTLHMVSQPGDYIGQGQTYDYSTATGAFSASGTAGSGVVGVSYSEPGAYGNWWNLGFAAPSGSPIAVGEYANAQRYPFQAAGLPGLDVSGDGRGSNTLTGSFDVTQVQYAADGTLLRFGATFEQHSEGATPALTGEVRYNYWTGALIPAGVLVNDSDPDGDALTAALLNGPSHGKLSLNPDGTFAYTPDKYFYGTDTFTYRAFDGLAYSAPATVTITVNHINQPPTAVADSYALDENTTLSTTATTGVLANDTDPDNDPLTAKLVSGPSHGTLTLSADGSFNYQANTNFYGADTFTYQASDGKLSSATQTVTLTVRHVNQPPVANPDTLSTDENVTLTLPGILPPTGTGVMTLHMVSQPGDYIGQGQTYDYSTATGAFSASGKAGSGVVGVSYSEPGAYGNWWNLTFAAPSGSPLAVGPYAGAERYPFQAAGLPGLDVSGDGRGSNTLTGSFDVTQVQYAADGTLLRFGATFEQHSEGATPALTGEVRYNYWNSPLVPAVLANDTDPDNDPLQFVLVSGPSHGTLTVNADGSMVYVPNTNFYGTDTFTYKVNDGKLDSAPAAVTINVNHVNQPPTAVNDAYTLNQDTTLNADAISGVLSNDTDPDNDPLTAQLVNGPAHGTLTLNADGSFSYAPTAGYYGTDSFTYTASDGKLSSGPATVTLTVQHVNHPPVANADAYTLNQDTALSANAASGVLTNDTDPDGDPITAQLATGPAHGTLALNADGSFTYTPATGFYGTDSFTYTASDGSLSSAPATVTLTVQHVNHPPVANADAYALDQDTTLSTSASAGVLANDTDADGDRLTASLVNGPAHGQLTLNADGSFVYQPSAHYRGTDSFTYQAFDGQAYSAPATVTITVRAVEHAPVAAADSYTVNEDTPLSVPAAGVLANDTDPDGDPITAQLVNGPSHGTLTLNADGSFNYTPAAEYTGTDSFTYTAFDGTLRSAVTTVTLTVQHVNDAPTAVAGPNQTADEGQSVAFDGRGSTVPQGEPVTYTWDFGDHSTGSGATVNHVYADNGTYTVKLTVADSDGDATSSLLTVTVRNVAPTPTFSGPSSAVRGQERVFNFSATDPSSVDTAAGFTYVVNWGDGQTQTVTGPAAGGQLAHTWTGSGNYTVTLTVTDKDGGSASTSQSVAVTAVAMQGNDLVVGGTTGNDRITLQPADTTGGVKVTINGVVQGVYRPTGDLIVYGQAGDDILEVVTSKFNGRTYQVSRPAYLFGGAGNDTLDVRGTSVGSVLIGGDGIDTLLGGSGRDILVGGAGADNLQGNGGSDLLIGGSTTYDGNLAAWRAIRAEWVRTDVTAATRKSHLNGSLAAGLNGSFVLNGTTVLDDGVTDTLVTDSSDWVIPS